MRLFTIAAAMEFRHLPVAGGIYDQHPQLIDEWIVIWEAKAAHQKREAEIEKRKSQKKRKR